MFSFGVYSDSECDFYTFPCTEKKKNTTSHWRISPDDNTNVTGRLAESVLMKVFIQFSKRWSSLSKIFDY